jgi:hypothetical protein
MSSQRITSILIPKQQRQKVETLISPEKEPGDPDAHLPAPAVIPEVEVVEVVIPGQAVAAVPETTLTVVASFIRN